MAQKNEFWEGLLIRVLGTAALVVGYIALFTKWNISNSHSYGLDDEQEIVYPNAVPIMPDTAPTNVKWP